MAGPGSGGGPGTATANPHAATRRAGACFGCLYKQHTSLTVPPNLSWMHDRLEAQRDVHVGAADSLAEAVGGNERGKSYDYCVLVGNVLTSYESYHCYRRGDHATSEVRIVGASAWNPPPTKTRRGRGGSFSTVHASMKPPPPVSPIIAPLSSETSSPVSKYAPASVGGSYAPPGSAPAPAMAAASPPAQTQTQTTTPVVASASAQSTGPPTFRLVTYAGTHIYCSAPTPADRDTWLAALHAGLEASYASAAETLTSITASSSEDGVGLRRSSGGSKNRLSRSPPKRVREPTVASNDQTILTPPVPQRQSRIGQALRRKLSSASSSQQAAAGAQTLSASDGGGTNVISSHGYAPPYESNAPPSTKHCISCGRYPPETAYRPSSAPLPQYGMECRVDLCADCLISQGLYGHVTAITGLYAADAHERAALTQARDLAVGCVEEAVRVAEEEEERQRQERLRKSERELAALVAEAGAREIGGGGGGADPPRVRDGGGGNGEEDGSGGERSNSTEDTGCGTASSSSWTNVDSTVNSHGTAHTEGDLIVEDAKDDDDQDGEDEEQRRHKNGRTDRPAAPGGSPLSGSWADVSHSGAAPAAAQSRQSQSQAWVAIPPTPTTTTALLTLVSTPDFQALRRRSRILEWNCRALEGGGIGCSAEFLDSLEEHAREASASSAVSAEEVSMKKEALRHAGDMGAAVRLLKESARGGGGGGAGGSTDTLACVLEFLLDLCEEGELAAVAFFWPQLRQIHLQMLPPSDAGSLVRAELVEDFLLTVAVRHSVHLALELVWGCIADLEESLGTPNEASPGCRRRRFAVLRFVCELESLLFDFDGGWGGGSVSLRAMLSPSQHQAVLVKDAVAKLQLHRMYGSHHLSRSVRLEKLRREADREDVEARAVDAINDRLWSDSASSSSSSSSMEKEDSDPSSVTATRARAETSDSVVAMNRVRIARNADYFSSQLMFTRRLGDIAERLRFTDVEQRSGLLRHELEVLNSSGRMGGDPLNGICDNDDAVGGLAHVVHVPSSEGHVFRSKERTPVLLLMEVIREESSIVGSRDRSTDEADPGGTDDDSLPQDMICDAENDDDEAHSIDTRDDINRLADKDGGAQAQSVPHKELLPGPTEVKRGGEGKSQPGTDGPGTDNERLVPPQPPAEVASGLDQGADAPSPMTSPKPSLHKVLESPMKGSASTQSGSGAQFSPAGKRSGVTPEKMGEMEDLVVSMMQNNLHIPNLNEEGRGVHDMDGREGTVTDEEMTANVSSKQPSSPKPLASSPTQKQSQSRNRNQRKVSAFSGALMSDSMDEMPNLSAHGEGRREVLTTIFLKGIRSSNLVARSAAPAAQRAVQAMDRKRAVELINKTSGTDDGQIGVGNKDAEVVRDFNEGIGMNSTAEDEFDASGGINTNGEVMAESNKDDDEVLEALRLLIIQNRVAQGNLSPEKAARVLALETKTTNAASAKATYQAEGDSEVVDAGDFDPRLAGCGTLPQTVLNALKLWRGGIITSVELLDLVHKDNQFLRHSALPGAENASKLMEDSAFWGRFAFGERWAEKKARIQTSSPHGAAPGWDLVGCIIKSNDDLRQEAFVMQLIELCQEAFEMSGLELWVHPYRVLATGRTTGIIELVRNAMSFDSLKKRPGYGNGGLRGHLQRMTEYAADPTEAFETAQRNFVRSLASYSLMSYLFLFKDRHNGNLMLDTAGHVIHIDFGFVFGIAPGGNFSLEQSVPFKLTEEMLDVMGGPRSPLFSEFVTLFCCGFLALQAHAETFITMVEITCDGSSFPCFEGRDSSDVVAKLRERFCTHMDKEATIVYALEQVRLATTSYGTKQYDYFQYLSQGIAS